jgi:hypothetical protein
VSKIKLQDLKKILSSDVIKNNSCIEMSFCIDNSEKYDDCWLGKMPSKTDSKQELYWYGIVHDGSQAYDYNILDNILNAKVFDGQSMCEIIENITWHSLDGCSIEEMLPYYLTDDSHRPRWSAPINIRVKKWWQFWKRI